MTSLYEISNEYQTALNIMNDMDMSQEEINDSLAAIEGEFEVKAINCIRVEKNMAADIDAISIEIKRLTDKKKAKVIIPEEEEEQKGLKDEIQLLKDQIKAKERELRKEEFHDLAMDKIDAIEKAVTQNRNYMSKLYNFTKALEEKFNLLTSAT